MFCLIIFFVCFLLVSILLLRHIMLYKKRDASLCFKTISRPGRHQGVILWHVHWDRLMWKYISFVEGKENGCNGFSLCDVLQVALTLSANQRRDNDCKPTASLTLLSNSNAVKALKVATQLTWTGQMEILGNRQPCKYIYDQQPGLQDMPSKNKTLDKYCGPAGK